MKAFGFTNTDIKAQNVARSVFVLSLGDLVGWLEGKREILSVWETVPEMKAGNAVFRQVYRVGEVELGRLSRLRQQVRTQYFVG
jgi:hypothetical protein